ncbi:MAG: hypothetical protein GF416_04855 [Candidatus Altiarchaeales archaeon]|nr:hypothetical protein [Candidatus Altiarchaeales archaeon]MBD3416450.1 hypothetical protein [Candidatus Altiarchaeales archaeon]
MRIETDYGMNTNTYNIIFKSSPEDRGMQVSVGNSNLQFKPDSLNTLERTSPSFNPYFTDSEQVTYYDVFGKGIDMEYQMLPNKVKEKIIIDEKNSIPSLSSSTVSIDFTLIYSEDTDIYVEGKKWMGNEITTNKDIPFKLKTKQGIIYQDPTVFLIEAPTIEDNTGKIEPLVYRLTKEKEKIKLSLEIPYKLLNEAQYPIEIDPTVKIGGDENYFKWQNLNNCSTNTNACEDIFEEPDYIQFKTQPFCWGSAYEGVSKPLFRFNVSHLNWKTAHHATLHYYGSCVGEEYMPSGYNIQLFRVNSFTETPDCSNNADVNTSSSLVTLMYEDTCSEQGSQTLDITDIFQDALNGDEYLAFKTDIAPELPQDEQPGQNDHDYYYGINKGGTQLFIEYAINCTSSTGNCFADEFCNITYMCEGDLDYGDPCENVTADNDDEEACPHDYEECVLDEYDGIGYFCDEEDKCVHDSTIYNEGDKHCYNTTAYKQCTSGTFGNIIECDPGYVCNDPSGCQQGNPDLVAKNANIIFFRIR